MSEREKLKKLAEAAALKPKQDWPFDEEKFADGYRFWLAANPSTILALLSQLESSEAALRTLREASQRAKDAIRDNHQWHIDHDDFDGYADSELQEKNLKALGDLAAALADDGGK